MKLELKHLAPYLPYGLKAKMLDYTHDYVGKEIDEIKGLYYLLNNQKEKLWHCETGGGSRPSITSIKPILKPLSDLTEKELDMFPLADRYYVRLISENQTYHYGSLIYSTVLYLCKEHYDFQNLIQKGLAINKKTLK